MGPRPEVHTVWHGCLDMDTYSNYHECYVANHKSGNFLQYLEEPVQDVRDLPAYFSQTGIPIGLDESLDEAFAAQHHNLELTLEERLAKLLCELGEGAVGGLVVKPGAIGGFEKALDLHCWAFKHGIHVSDIHRLPATSCSACRPDSTCFAVLGGFCGNRF